VGTSSVWESAGRADAGEREGLPAEPVDVELEGARGAFGLTPDDSPDAASGVVAIGEFLSVLRGTTSSSKSFTYTTLDLAEDAFESCVTRDGRAVFGALGLGLAWARKANKKNSGIKRNNFIDLPRRANRWQAGVNHKNIMTQEWGAQRSPDPKSRGSESEIRERHLEQSENLRAPCFDRVLITAGRTCSQGAHKTRSIRFQRGRLVTGLIAFCRRQDGARFMIPEDEPGAGVPGGKDLKTLPGNLEILETLQPEMPAVGVLDQDVVDGLNHRRYWCCQGVLPSAE
jgi:hypothetical protein